MHACSAHALARMAGCGCGLPPEQQHEGCHTACALLLREPLTSRHLADDVPYPPAKKDRFQRGQGVKWHTAPSCAAAAFLMHRPRPPNTSSGAPKIPKLKPFVCNTPAVRSGLTRALEVCKPAPKDLPATPFGRHATA